MNAKQEAELEQFKKERNVALLTLDKETIQAHHFKWNGRRVSDDIPEVFWGSVHKCITGIPSLPLDFRKASKKYLDDHGLQSLDDGDL